MIYGVGTDIVAVKRLQALWERHGEKTGERILAPSEYEDFAQASDKGRFLAKRFAAKEAFSKALGTGVRPPATLSSIAITHDELGELFLRRSGEIEPFALDLLVEELVKLGLVVKEVPEFLVVHPRDDVVGNAARDLRGALRVV